MGAGEAGHDTPGDDAGGRRDRTRPRRVHPLRRAACARARADRLPGAGRRGCRQPGRHLRPLRRLPSPDAVSLRHWPGPRGRGRRRGTGRYRLQPWGRKVWTNSLGHAGRQGSFCEYAVVPADRLYPLPPDLDPTDLVAAAHPAASAWLARFRHGRLRYGDTVYVGGGAGKVGSAGVALAATAGARVVATARADDLDFVASLGATEVIDYASSDAVRRVGRSAPEGYDLYLDTSGTADPAVSIDQLAHGGRLVVMVGLHATPAVPIGRLYTRDASIVGFAISNASVADLAGAARGVTHLLHTTSWRPRVAEILELSETARAHRQLEERRLKGRLVLQP